MDRHHDRILFSATDVVNFLDCRHLTALDLRNLQDPQPTATDDAYAQLLQDKGLEHELLYLQHLKRVGVKVVEIDSHGREFGGGCQATREAMQQGADIIYQAFLRLENLVGYADFLRRAPYPSRLGDYSYEVIDTKLARSPQPKFIIQLCCYTHLLTALQDTAPRLMHLVLGDGTERTFRVAAFIHYYRRLQQRFRAFLDGRAATYPEPCERCELCNWRDHCQARWAADDHLCQVANITRRQIRQLRTVGIDTLAQLATLDDQLRVPGIHAEALNRLRQQATLQLDKRRQGEHRYQLLPEASAALRGLARLPRPDPGDVFFDMEGDPLAGDGLEYLFGLYYQGGPEWRFQAFWAHTEQAEQQAFEAVIDFIKARRASYPSLHIYHYGHYEDSALKRLMCQHGTRETEVDDLLRHGTLVDLYKVVREALLVSEPRYSIKNLEHFYMPRRQGEITHATASLVYYEQWRLRGDNALLEQIRAYNEDDCRSTYLLREWLIGLRPARLPWFATGVVNDAIPDQTAKRQEAEARLAGYRQRLLATAPVERLDWSAEDHLRELVFQLLDFHRRTAKPQWWALFARRAMSEEELLEDPECIASLERDPGQAPVKDKRALIYTYRFPEQTFKLKVGDRCLQADTLGSLGTIDHIDEEARLLRLKISANKTAPERLTISSTGPIDTKVLREAIYRYADALLDGNPGYAAITRLLRKEAPRIQGHPPGSPILNTAADLLPQIIEAVANLASSYLFIQGPPGTGKTAIGSRVITELLRRGFRVGVSSNSHKAIINLLQAVESHARAVGFAFTGIKKSDKAQPDTWIEGQFIRDVFGNQEICAAPAALIAGTAWLFARPELDQQLDILFVDEAGQVALANLVAMATSARNLVLLGDQMQLPQPIEGVHPGHSGEAVLEYLLDGAAVIPPANGIFLATTWRLHPDLCRFISSAVYDERLQPQPDNQRQRLLLKDTAHPELRPTGIRFIPIEHEGCAQESAEEAAVVRVLYHSLLDQAYRDRAGREQALTAANILVVTPYNLQVNRLQRTLPSDARVGTVDKFQGQEAEVVIISLATSSGEELPRDIEFLFSKHRLNVALSRARCLALLVASPALLTLQCATVEQLALVNTLCWLQEYASRGPTGNRV